MKELPSLLPERQRRERTYHIQSHSRLISRLALVAATLLVVSLIIILPFIRSSHTNPATAQPSVTSVGGKAPGGIYLANTTGVLRIDPATGATLKSYHVVASTQLFSVANEFLYIIGYAPGSQGQAGDIGFPLGADLYGVNLTTGATWHQSSQPYHSAVFTAFHVLDGVLHASLYNINQANGDTTSFLMAFSASSGVKQWQSQAIPGKTHAFTIAHKVIYFGTDAPLTATTCGCKDRFDAYDIGQHKLLWQQQTNGVATSTIVEAGIVYAVTSDLNAGIGYQPEIIALSADQGKLQWCTPVELAGLPSPWW